MLAAQIVLVIVTVSLVCVTYLYARHAKQMADAMMRATASQERAERFNNQPVVGIEVPLIFGEPLGAMTLNLTTFQVVLRNLRDVPILRIKLITRLEVGGKPARRLYDDPVFPFMGVGEQVDATVRFEKSHDEVLESSLGSFEASYSEVEDEETPRYSDKGSGTYPVLRIEVQFQNHMGDGGYCRSTLKLIPEWRDGEPLLKTEPVGASESLECGLIAPLQGD